MPARRAASAKLYIPIPCILGRMEYEWDAAKSEANRAKHGIAFQAVYRLEWDTARVARSDRHDEIRYAAVGYIDSRLYVVIFTMRRGHTRIISVRPASRREKENYAQS